MNSKDAKRQAQLKARERKRQQAEKRREKKHAGVADTFLNAAGRWIIRDHSKREPFMEPCPGCSSEIQFRYEDNRLHYEHMGEGCEGYARFIEMVGTRTPPLDTLTQTMNGEGFYFKPETGDVVVTGEDIDAAASESLGTKATGSVTLSASPDLIPQLPAWARGHQRALTLAEGEALIASGAVESTLTISHGEGNRVTSMEVIARTAEGLFRFPARKTHTFRGTA